MIAESEDIMLVTHPSTVDTVSHSFLADFIHEIGLTSLKVISQLSLVLLSLAILSFIWLKVGYVSKETNNELTFHHYALDKLGFFVLTKKTEPKIEKNITQDKPISIIPKSKTNSNKTVQTISSYPSLKNKLDEILSLSGNTKLDDYETFQKELETAYQQKSLDEKSYGKLQQEVKKNIYWEIKFATIPNVATSNEEVTQSVFVPQKKKTRKSRRNKKLM